MKKGRILRWFRRALLTAVAVAVWLVGVAVWISAYGSKDGSRKSDCAIVLGAAAYGTKPSPVFAERINHAVELYRKGTVKYVLFTGGAVKEEDKPESRVGRSHAMLAGVPAAAILTETRSRTTVGNLQEAKQVMDREGLRTAVIVSDPLHLKRADAIASRLGMEAVTSPTPTSRYRSWRVKAEFLFREVLFLHGYWLTGK